LESNPVKEIIVIKDNDYHQNKINGGGGGGEKSPQ